MGKLSKLQPTNCINFYVVGFDCAHSEDLIPFLTTLTTGAGEYRNIDYVKDECRKLAKQLKEHKI